MCIWFKLNNRIETLTKTQGQWEGSPASQEDKVQSSTGVSLPHTEGLTQTSFLHRKTFLRVRWKCPGVWGSLQRKSKGLRRPALVPRPEFWRAEVGFVEGQRAAQTARTGLTKAAWQRLHYKRSQGAILGYTQTGEDIDHLREQKGTDVSVDKSVWGWEGVETFSLVAQGGSCCCCFCNRNNRSNRSGRQNAL